MSCPVCRQAEGLSGELSCVQTGQGLSGELSCVQTGQGTVR